MSIFDKVKQFFAKERPALYRKITVAPPTNNFNDPFGVSLKRYHEIRDHLAPLMLRMNIENMAYSTVVDIIFTDEFLKTEQEQILAVFQTARLVQEMKNKGAVGGNILSLLKQAVEQVKGHISDEDLEEMKVAHPDIVEETNCGNPECRVHGELNRKKKSRSSRPIN